MDSDPYYMHFNSRKNRKAELEFCWILFGTNLLQDQRQTITQLKEQEISILDGNNFHTGFFTEAKLVQPSIHGQKTIIGDSNTPDD